MFGLFSDAIEYEEYGIHTLEFYAGKLKYTQVQKIIDDLEELGEIQRVKDDKYGLVRAFKSNYLAEIGVRLIIHQSYSKANGIGFIVNPSSLLAKKYQPTALWTPTGKSFEKLLKRMKDVLHEIKAIPHKTGAGRV